MDVQGKGVFLTGGAQGLGRGIVEKLLSLGAKVLFCDVDVGTGKSTEADLQQQHGQGAVFFQHADVSDGDQHKEAFEAAVKKFGAVEICINNVGIINERNWEKVLAVNTGSHIRGSLLALEHMRRDRGGRGGVIINVSSTMGLFPMAPSPIYAASKHAVVGFTTSWAASPDQQQHGVRWCCLCPDAFNTEMMRQAVNNDKDLIYHAEILRQYIQNRGTMSVSQVAEAVMKLVQDPDNNGAILEVSLLKGAKYRRRQVVDRDGVSDLVVADTY